MSSAYFLKESEYNNTRFTVLKKLRPSGWLKNGLGESIVKFHILGGTIQPKFSPQGTKRALFSQNLHKISTS